MGRKVILLVEDNPDDEALTLHTFKQSNIVNEVVVARDGVEALDYLFGSGVYAGRDTSIMPQVILLDLKLPKLNGLEVLRQFKSHDISRTIPVVVLTTSTEDSDVQTAYELGANSYIVKPVDFEKFMHVAEQIELYWTVLNKPPR